MYIAHFVKTRRIVRKNRVSHLLGEQSSSVQSSSVHALGTLGSPGSCLAVELLTQVVLLTGLSNKSIGLDLKCKKRSQSILCWWFGTLMLFFHNIWDNPSH